MEKDFSTSEKIDIMTKNSFIFMYQNKLQWKYFLCEMLDLQLHNHIHFAMYVVAILQGRKKVRQYRGAKL